MPSTLSASPAREADEQGPGAGRRAGAADLDDDSQQLVHGDLLASQNSGYLKQATSGFRRWESRQKFWGAVGKGAEDGAQGLSLRAASSDARLRITHWFKIVAAIIRRHPSVLVAPLLLCIACLAGGLCGVLLTARGAEQRRRDDAAVVAAQTAGALQLLAAQALQPAAALAAAAWEAPRVAELAAALPLLGPGLLQQERVGNEAANEGLGERVRLTARAHGANSAVFLLAQSSPPPSSVHGISAAVPLALAGPPGSGVELELWLHREAGWAAPWEAPLIAVVVLTSLALSAMLFLALFNASRHAVMLKHMLPKKVVDVLNTGSHYYQHFECVTMLYADVVRYTAKEGAGLPTLEVINLLNAVHSMYDAIAEKYGLIRIRRSGESFLCVGGCPTPDDPVAVAVRVASCARELVMMTARFRSGAGFRVQIRIGLHSGPVVAAVVGTKMPRFSLFGDGVDVSYFMEATSRAMAVHVSETAMQLLVMAGAGGAWGGSYDHPLLQLDPRGPMEVHGRGSLATAWLRLETLPDPAAASADGEDEGGEGGALDGVELGPGGITRARRGRGGDTGAVPALPTLLEGDPADAHSVVPTHSGGVGTGLGGVVEMATPGKQQAGVGGK
ncbi:Soluble guanylate cyclase 88E [Tetrabaena socialis]|uniref:Soluble guanylate cyclase 88E n=1 Tax=Tetrabaena socialis TaxID=47790 RepID=A0A2J7ZX32_9CHLO|nr:Soluble guanylate cyclase 88E [Tetrabaena socialis]|eukprot:PNH04816.1 Soluble guanylate cyclase 88E [Tetrabaena socialis]